MSKSKNRIVFPASLILIDGQLIEVRKRLESADLYDAVLNRGVYLIRNKLTNKYYVGSTDHYWERFFHRGHNYRGHYRRNDGIITHDNVEEFEFILLTWTFNLPIDEIRKLERRIILFLKSYLPEYGYNRSRNGQSFKHGGNEGGFWINNGMDNKFIYDDEIPEGWSRGMFRGKLITNLDGVTLNWKSRTLPEGFYPGQRNTSGTKRLLEFIDPALLDRNKEIDSLDLLEITLGYKEIRNNLGEVAFVVNQCKDVLEYFYNIKILIDRTR